MRFQMRDQRCRHLLLRRRARVEGAAVAVGAELLLDLEP
jgi:hypothetical protein